MDADQEIKSGIACLRSGRVNDATVIFRNVLAADSGNIEALVLLGSTEQVIGNHNEAIKLLEKAMSAGGGDIRAPLNLGVAYLAVNNPKAAEKAFQAAYAINPKDSYVTYNLGILAEKNGDSNKAIDFYTASIAADPDFVNAYTHLCDVFKESDQQPAILSFLRDAEKRFPDSVNIKYYRGKLASSIVPAWHFPMIADQSRNDVFEAALEKLVRPDDIVLDIGTGSGLLAMMAARAGASHVYACEVNETLAMIAKEIVALNGYADKITVINKMSSDLKIGADLPRKADLLVAEILNNAVVGEGVVPAFKHAASNLLVDNARIIPERATLYGVLAECEYLRNANSISMINGFDLSPFNALSNPLGPMQFIMSHGECGDYNILTDPFVVAEYDFSSLPEAKTVTEVNVKGIAEGTGDTVIMWFDLYLCDGIMISTKTTGPENHWRQAVQPLKEKPHITAGANLSMTIEHSVFFSFRIHPAAPV